MKLVICGVGGRMGQALVAAAKELGHTITAGVERKGVVVGGALSVLEKLSPAGESFSSTESAPPTTTPLRSTPAVMVCPSSFAAATSAWPMRPPTPQITSFMRAGFYHRVCQRELHHLANSPCETGEMILFQCPRSHGSGSRFLSFRHPSAATPRSPTARRSP